MADMLTVLSLGGGVQSTTLLLLACHGALERPDLILFADTGAEPAPVYAHLEWLSEEAGRHGLRVERVSAGNLAADLERAVRAGTRVANPPFFVRLGRERGMLSRDCTRDYKIAPIRKRIREELAKRGRERAELWLGITVDEVERVRDSDVAYIVHRYPLIERGMRRSDCLAWLEKHGYPTPPKSACWFCPFRSDAGWRWLRDHSPDDWEKACRLDRLIRRLPRVRGEVYVHASCRPLAEAPFTQQPSLWEAECHGVCGL